MDDPTDAQLDAALERGRQTGRYEPRAAAARYNQRSARIIVNLADGCTFAFPPKLTQGLEAATEAQLGQVEIFDGGSGLHWEALDVGPSVPCY